MQEIDYVFTTPLGEIKTATYYSKGGAFIDGSSIKGFRATEDSDLYLKPEKEFTINGNNIVICDVLTHDKKEFHSCPRSILKKVLAKYKEFRFEMGAEIEFFITKKGELIDETGYFSDDFEFKELRKEICRRMISAGITPTVTHHEVASSQHEINFMHSEALTTADNVVATKMIIKRVCAEKGFEANFMPKPFKGINGSGMHCHISVWNKEKNLFYSPNGLPDFGKKFVNGLLSRASALCALTNPTVNSYKRLRPGFEAPSEIKWGYRDRTSIIRIPAHDSEGGARIEFRAPDALSNPYLVLAGMVIAGMNGVENGSAGEARGKLPTRLKDALKKLGCDEVIKKGLGEEFVETYLKLKYEEWEEYATHITDWEKKKYLAM
ncbi:MAG: glutamine synthetase [Nanoarchaeota archaeon]|nr:glutamine synthetase [Nanoarchaeota archaeon]